MQFQWGQNITIIFKNMGSIFHSGQNTIYDTGTSVVIFMILFNIGSVNKTYIDLLHTV